MNSTRLDRLEGPNGPGVLESLFRGRTRSLEESVPEYRNSHMDPMKALAAEYRQKLREEAERKAEEERLKRLPLQEWNEFRQLLRTKMAAFNTHMQEVTLTWDCDDPDQIVMTRKSDERVLNGRFDEATATMRIECAPAQIDFRCIIAVQSQAAVYLQPEDQTLNRIPLTRDGLTNNFLRDFLLNE